MECRKADRKLRNTGEMGMRKLARGKGGGEAKRCTEGGERNKEGERRGKNRRNTAKREKKRGRRR